MMIAMMLVLAVTSFPQVRNRMNGSRWKKLHRLAYVFYGLIYVHVLLIYVPLALSGRWFYWVNIAVYSFVFVGYAIMRIARVAKSTDCLNGNPLRILWIILGFVCLGVGTIGVVLPVLPTVPFYM